MADTLPAAAAGNPKGVLQFADAAHVYIQMLRNHIHKEDHCLFGMADSLLSATDQERLEADFETVEHEQACPCTHAHCLAIAEKLARRFNVPETVSASLPEHAHCCTH
jgi:hemerythrin-like domain-containing protein